MTFPLHFLLRQRDVQELNLNEMKAELERLELLKKEKQANNARVQAEVDELKNSLTIGRSSRLIKEGMSETLLDWKCGTVYYST